MNIQKKEVGLNLPGPCIRASAIVDSDAIVNDSKPDLLKIISVDALPRVTKTEILNGRMMVSGHIVYKVLYQPEGGGGVCSIHTGVDFSHMEENTGFCEGMYSDVSLWVEHVETELINSRKIKIKSVVAMDVKSEKAGSVLIPVSTDGDNLVVKKGHISGHSGFLQKRDIISISDALTIPAGKPAVGSLLKTDVSLCNKDIKVISGKVIIKGEIAICTLYISETDAGVVCCNHILPFTEILDAEGLSEEHKCRVKTEIEECDFSLATDSEGEVRVINATVRLGVRISADAAVEESIVSDIYSLTDVMNVEYKTVKLQTAVYHDDFDYSLSGMVRPSGHISSVYNVCAHPEITSASARDGKIVMEGYAGISMLCMLQDSSSPVMSHTDEIPFRIEMVAEQACGDVKVDWYVETDSIVCNMNPSGEVELKILLKCSVALMKEENYVFVDSAESAGLHSCPTPSMVLYFVQTGDCLWDIAKRYHTKTEYISQLNGDAAEKLVPGSQLLIPRG